MNHGNHYNPQEFNIEAYTHVGKTKTFLGCTTEYDTRGKTPQGPIMSRFKTISETIYRAKSIIDGQRILKSLDDIRYMIE